MELKLHEGGDQLANSNSDWNYLNGVV
jgi:hypothetical protein